MHALGTLVSSGPRDACPAFFSRILLVSLSRTLGSPLFGGRVPFTLAGGEIAFIQRNGHKIQLKSLVFVGCSFCNPSVSCCDRCTYNMEVAFGSGSVHLGNLALPLQVCQFTLQLMDLRLDVYHVQNVRLFTGWPT